MLLTPPPSIICLDYLAPDQYCATKFVLTLMLELCYPISMRQIKRSSGQNLKLNIDWSGLFKNLKIQVGKKWHTYHIIVVPAFAFASKKRKIILYKFCWLTLFFGHFRAFFHYSENFETEPHLKKIFFVVFHCMYWCEEGNLDEYLNQRICWQPT